MQTPEILCAWLGNSDIREARQREDGPILKALRKKTYSQLLLLYALDEKDAQLFIRWVEKQSGTPVTAINCRLDDPTDFAAIYQAAKEALTLTRTAAGGEVAFTYHISPGTQAMGAAWIVLSQSHYKGSLIQAHRESGVSDIIIPFDVAADYIPQWHNATRADLERTVTEQPARIPFGSFDWRTPAMGEVIEKATLLARYDSIPVLILGENGSGKEELANYIHRNSSRARKPLIIINCGAIPENLVEAELFGSSRGAFSDARDRAGYLEQADGGTLFLDEIGDLPLAAQVKFLRVLQQKKFKRVGGEKEIACDFRIICATNHPLDRDVAEGLFREDLFYRIAGATICLPPLRMRSADLITFAALQLQAINRDLSRQPEYRDKSLGASAETAISGHTWPGNVRELNSVLTTAAVWCRTPTLEASDIVQAIIRIDRNVLPDVLGHPLGNGFRLEDVVATVEETYVRRALTEADNILSRAAQLLGASPQTFTNWARKFGLHPSKSNKAG